MTQDEVNAIKRYIRAVISQEGIAEAADLLDECVVRDQPDPPEPAPCDNRTPAQLRDAGVPYCPVCYTFGQDHARTCSNKGHGTHYHVVRSGS